MTDHDDQFASSHAQRWCALRVVHDRIDAAIESALQREHNISVREFTVLQMLADQDECAVGHFQMKEIAVAVALSQSATTRLVDRLEKRGLLSRYICPTDRRGIYTDVTPKGHDMFRRARPTNERALAEVLSQIERDPSLAPYVRVLRDTPESR